MIFGVLLVNILYIYPPLGVYRMLCDYIIVKIELFEEKIKNQKNNIILRLNRLYILHTAA